MIEHFNFLDSSMVLTTAIDGHYEPSLVALSVLIAALASYVAFSVSEKIKDDELTGRQYIWWMTGALVQGTGIWAMHFIAMLAFTLPFDVSYKLSTTVISVVPAVLASAVVLRTHHETEISLPNFIFKSVLMGSGIGLMHYIGMSAMHMNAMMAYDMNLFILSIVVAVVLAGIALRLKLWAERKQQGRHFAEIPLLVSAVVMGSAIASMHYTAMAATWFFPSEKPVETIISIPPFTLAWTIGIITTAIIVVMIIAVYVSQRFEILDMLEKSEAKIRGIISNTAEAIITIDDKGIVETFNPAAERIFGYSHSEIIGKNVSILIPLEHREQHDGYTRNSSMYEARIIFKDRTLEGQAKDGRIFPIELNVAPMFVGDKKGFVGVIRDVTERKKYEQIIMNAMEKAEIASKAKSEFLSHMSHELRTPLNAILGFGEVLKSDHEQPLTDEQTKYIDEILNSGRHLLTLINEILDLAKIESGKVSLEMSAAVPIWMISNDCISLVRGMAYKHEITLVNNIDQSKEYLVNVDQIRLKQILLNLLSNAIKYNKKGGTVTIDCVPRDQRFYRISVTDTGRGLTEQQMERLFRDFERVADDYQKIDGAGIGLSISKQLTELMDGKIGVSSKPGEGSVFWVEFNACNRDGEISVTAN